MNLKIYVGEANCTACGKKHKKIFEIDGKPYGSSCAKEIIGKDLTAPVWLYELAEQWAKMEKGTFYFHPEDSSLNFFNMYGENMEDRDGGSKLWLRPIKVQGKSVKKDWQLEIHDYIVQRYHELRGKIHAECRHCIYQSASADTLEELQQKVQSDGGRVADWKAKDTCPRCKGEDTLTIMAEGVPNER